MPNIFHCLLVVLMCMGLYFIKCTSYHGSMPPPFFCCGFLVMLYLADGSPQHFYQGMKKYVVIRLMSIYWSNPSDKIIYNSICIIFWSIVYIVSIKEDITPNPPFKISGPLLVILSISRNVAFGGISQVSLIGSYRMCSDNLNACVLTI